MRKFTKKAVSLAVASFVTVTSVFAGSPVNANAATTSIFATTNKQNDTYNVTFTAPSDWTGTIYAYAYYDVTGTDGKITQEEPLGYWPGTKATKVSGNKYSIAVPTTIGSAEVIFASITGNVGTEVKDGKRKNPDGTYTTTHYYECTTQAQLPEDGKGGLSVNSDADISSTGVITKITPTATPTNKPTATPVVTKPATPEVTTEPTTAPTVTPVSGPQVTVSEANGTSYYEETNDTLSVVVDLAEGAKSATYSVDNGPETTITGKTIVKLGEGKIANSAISLKVTSTDGTTTNTQEFTYYKKSKSAENVAKTTKKSVSSSMESLFGTVKTFATNTSKAKVLPVHFKIPASDWEGAGRTVYCYAYYVENNRIERPLGIWPGEPMTKNGDYYELNIDAPTGYVQLVFSSVLGAKGHHYYPGDTLKDGTIAVEEHYDCNADKKLPYGYYGSNPKEGIRIENEAWISQKGTATKEDSESLTITSSSPVSPIPSTATPTPSASAPASATPEPGKETPDPSASPTAPVSTELDGYFGASLSAPQYNTTKQTLSAVALNAKGNVTYAFSVDGKEIYSGSNDAIDWDTTGLDEGTHVIEAKITDSTDKVWKDTKNYTISVVKATEEPTATPVVTATPSAIPTATVEVTATPTAEPTFTPVVTVTPSAVPTVTPTTVPTVTPVITNAPINIDNSGIGNAPVTGGAVTSQGSIAISFSKKNKTAGETIKVNAKVSGIDEVYKLSYSVKKTGGKTKTLAKKVTKKTVSWTPTASGTYTVTVKAYSEDGKVLASKTAKYTVKKRVITISSVKPATLKVKKNATIKIKAKTTKGKLSMKVVIKNSKNKTVKTRKYSKKKTFTWKPSKKGTYKVTVTAKNGKGVVVSVTKKIKVKK